jgi:hypothetical protein
LLPRPHHHLPLTSCASLRLPFPLQITPAGQDNLCLGVANAKGGKFTTTACTGVPANNQLWNRWEKDGVFLQSVAFSTICLDSAGAVSVSGPRAGPRAAHVLRLTPDLQDARAHHAAQWIRATGVISCAVQGCF